MGVFNATSTPDIEQMSIQKSVISMSGKPREYIATKKRIQYQQ
jgi:hypothetical protein